jgi:hypothetical protein
MNGEQALVEQFMYITSKQEAPVRMMGAQIGITIEVPSLEYLRGCLSREGANFSLRSEQMPAECGLTDAHSDASQTMATGQQLRASF